MKAIGLFKPCIRQRLLLILSLFNRQPTYRLSKSVTLVSAVGLFKPCICLEAISDLVTFLTVSLTRGVQNIRLTRQPVPPTTNPPALCGSLSQAVWVGWVRPLKLRIGLGYRLKNCQPATTRPARLINNFTYIKKKYIYIYILVEIVKYLKLINSSNKFLQLIKQNWPSKNSLNKI